MLRGGLFMSKGKLLIFLASAFCLAFLGGCQEQSDARDSASPTRDLPAPGISAPVERPADPPVPSAAESPDPAELKRDFLWREDIEAFSMAYKAKHVDLCYWRDEDSFDRQVKELKEQAHELTDLEIVLGMKKIINSMQDISSQVYFDDEEYCDEFFPLQFRFMEDGLYIVNVRLGDFPDYQDVLYSKVAAVNEVDEAQIRERVFPLLCGERYETGRYALYAARFLPAYLYGTGVADWDQEFVFTLEREDGTVYDKKIETVSGAVNRSARPAVEYPMLFTVNPSENWYRYAEEDRTLYFAYNTGADRDDMLRTMFEEIRTVLLEEDAKNVVADLRNNNGGDAALLAPFVSMLTVLRGQYEKLYVVIGNNTFGSGTNNAKDLSDLDGAILIGEPTGDPLYGLSGQDTFSLPNSGLRCTYTTGIDTPDFGRTHLDFDDSPLWPDVYAPNTIGNYRNQTDAVWEYIMTAA